MLPVLPPVSPSTEGPVPVTTRSWWGPCRTLQLLLRQLLPRWTWCHGREEGNDRSTGSKCGGGDGFQASDAVTLSEPEAAEKDDGSTEGKGAAVKAEEPGQTEEPPALGVPRRLAQLPQLHTPALPGHRSLSARMSSPVSTQLKNRYTNTHCPAA